MTGTVSDEAEHIRQFALQLLTTTNDYGDLTLVHLAKATGKSVHWLHLHVFPPPQWPLMRDASARERLQQAMDVLYTSAQIQEDFTAEHIASQAGISTVTFLRLLRTEWQQRLKTLPTLRERVTTLVWQLVEEAIPLEDFTRKRIYDLVGRPLIGVKWLPELYRTAYLELKQRQCKQGLIPPLEGDGRFIAGTWIDLDKDSWDLRKAGSCILKRERLRSDIAAIAWPLLREELREGMLSPGTVVTHYHAFCVAGRLLGKEIPDVRSVSLEGLQRAWISYPGTILLHRRARTGLLRLFEAQLSSMSEKQDDVCSELLQITGWLRDLISLPHDEPASEFLTEQELNIILTSCFADIQTGMVFMNAAPDLPHLSSRDKPEKSESVRVVIYWAVALMILVMACTGLRRQSILALEVGDWMELRPGMFGIIWRHWKKGEEHLAVISPIIAHHLQQYVHCTAALRTALGTKSVFLNGNPQGLWEPMKPGAFETRLDGFVSRHQLQRNGTDIHLGSTIFRRTFTTRALYEGQSIEAIRSQLGHTTVMSTLLYSKLDLFEHPAQVRAPLDLYGRHALTLWKTPLLLGELPIQERMTLLKERVMHDQEVGLCRHTHCVQLDQGSPPPCSLCEHLITGKAFLPAWHRELQAREQGLETLKARPDAAVLYAQLKGQRDQFKRNVTFIEAMCEE